MHDTPADAAARYMTADPHLADDRRQACSMLFVFSRGLLVLTCSNEGIIYNIAECAIS